MVTQPGLFPKVVIPTFLLLTFLVPTSLLTAQGGPAPTRGWRVRHLLTAEKASSGRRVTLTIDSNRIVTTDKKGSGISISVPDVEAVLYDNVIRSLISTKDYVQGAGELGAGGAFLGFLGLPVFLALHQHKSKDHFILIFWKEQGQTHDAIFQVDKGDYGKVLEELERVTGRKWRDIPAERQRLRREIEQNARHATPLRLDRCVVVSTADLPMGLYQIVLLEREPGRADLLFFAGKAVDPKRLLAQASVEIVAASNAVPGAMPRYGEEANFFTLSEICLPDTTLRFSPQSLPGDPRMTVRRIHDAKGWWVLVRYGKYGEEPALRVPVVHQHAASPPCEGTLYVTPTRVVYEPQTPGAQNDRFTAVRSEIQAQVSSANNMPSLKISLPGRNYNFTPIVERGDSRRPISLSPSQRCGGESFPTLMKFEQCIGCEPFAEFLISAISDFAGVEREFLQRAGPR